ncbi:Cytochrome p450 [Thalictrum thalictroides]|uniref:Cytochrome p450 n=1 Tax=Thalictrum thalictroides TaxID=46969 RepID=A0A7J6VDR7_THATH|nr:Cytochrome p450 [Thalictrum thalictroides]
MWFSAVMAVVALVIIWMTNWVYRWRNPSCNGKLPPGSMGFPLLGETLQFFKPVSSFDIHPFVKDRMKRYGSLFKTSLVGCPDQRRAISILKDLIKERLVSAKRYEDFLDVVIEEVKKFASFETVALTITLAINFISEHPSVLKDLMVIDETLRLANINPLLLRRATRDVQIEGYTIPDGWMVMVCPPALHLNPEKYNNTLDFNPWRWKGQGSNTASKNFMAFGGGMRLCAGAEFAKLQVAVVLQFLVTKYRWTKIKGGEVVMAPGIIFPNGLHIKVTEK